MPTTIQKIKAIPGQMVAKEKEIIKGVGKAVFGITPAEKTHADVTGAAITTGRMPNGNDFRVWFNRMIGRTPKIKKGIGEKFKGLPTSDGYMKIRKGGEKL